MATKYKSAKVVKEYRCKAYGWDIVVPVGATVDNSTACGNSDDYRFLRGGKREVARAATGVENSILLHDLTYRGLNIPAEYCEPYPKGEW